VYVIIVRRLLLMLPLMLGMTLIAFVVSHSVPADPVKPDIHWRACQCAGRYSDRCGSALGIRQAAMPFCCIACRRAVSFAGVVWSIGAW